MDPASILTATDYEKPRTPAEFLKWWMSIHNAYGATKAGRDYCRASRALTKRFYEEAQVLLAFVQAYYRNADVLCHLHAGSGADDALIEDRRSRKKKAFQLTFAADSHNEHFRSMELSRTGSVDALAKPIVVVSGRKRSIVFPEQEAIDHSEVVSEIVQLLKARLSQKEEKKYGSPTALVVGFDDGFIDDADVRHFRAAYDGSFPELFFVGLHGRIAIPSKEA